MYCKTRGFVKYSLKLPPFPPAKITGYEYLGNLKLTKIDQKIVDYPPRDDEEGWVAGKPNIGEVSSPCEHKTVLA